MVPQKISRRNFLQSAGIGALAFMGSNLHPFSQRGSLFNALSHPGAMGLLKPRNQMEPFEPDAEISITAAPKSVQILSGAQTTVWSYFGELLSGSGVTVQNLPGCYLGPILRAQSGKKVRIYFHNNLAEDSVIHPHGLHVPEDCDGSPMWAIGPGEVKIYEFEVVDPAGPYWFHPHPHMRTAEQVLMGMAGLFYVTDPVEEQAVPGASNGLNDIPVIIQDRNFDLSNQLLYNPNQMWGYLGGNILVNGAVNATLSLEPRCYRLRVLNGSNARTYKLAWSNGMPLNVIGTDGGLLPAVQTRSYVMLMPGERVDLWADFSTLARQQVILRSLSYNPGGMGGGGRGSMGSGMSTDGMGGGGGGGGGGGCRCGGGYSNGTAFNIMTVNVSRRANSNPVLGPLPPLPVHYTPDLVPNYYLPRTFTLEMSMMVWTINGRVYEMEEVAEDEMVNLNDIEAWEWINNSPIPHPMHIHNVQFQVVNRTPPANRTSYDTVSQGLIDTGWKDTVLVWPGERVKVAMKFSPYAGMYMYHCHILEHEDMTMMRNYMIMDGGMMP
ncbi:MAG TPA: multicopper oxidase family protein [Anaerolineales bacterium]|nr:multicopper oxidase family protein [Anaerolineales bacterium]